MGMVDIRDYLKQFSGKGPVYYCPNPGLAGDVLIGCVTFQLFRDLNIDFRLVDGRTFDAKDKVFFYGGGGNFIPPYRYAAEVISRVHHSAKKIVILPHTIFGNEALLKRLGNNVDIICREENSYDHVRKFAAQAKVMLSHDMAFFLDTNKILSPSGDSLGKAIRFELQYLFKKDKGDLSRSLELKQLTHFLKKEIVLFRTWKKGKTGILNCFRTDEEKTDIELPHDNVDLPRILAYGREGEAIYERMACGITNQFLRCLNRYVKIRTNRLHVAIAALLLGKEVELYKNSYYKNEAVYKYSIENRFPRVRWIANM